MKAIFLDRDGVINDNSNLHYIFRTENFVFVDGIFDNLLKLQNRGFALFVVSNQGGIAKNIYSEDDVHKLHQYMIGAFAEKGVQIQATLFCPHHPSVAKCFCRKPSPLMIEKLIAQYGICPSSSWFIGDSETDMQAAERAGVKGVLVGANKNIGPYIDQIF